MGSGVQADAGIFAPLHQVRIIPSTPGAQEPLRGGLRFLVFRSSIGCGRGDLGAPRQQTARHFQGTAPGVLPNFFRNSR